jgi:hypothetical protein
MREALHDIKGACKGTNSGGSAVGLGQQHLLFSFACSKQGEDEGDALPRHFLSRVEMSGCNKARYWPFIWCAKISVISCVMFLALFLFDMYVGKLRLTTARWMRRSSARWHR